MKPDWRSIKDGSVAVRRGWLAAVDCRRLPASRPFQTDYFLYFPKALYDTFGGVERLLRSVPLGGQCVCFCHAMAED